MFWQHIPLEIEFGDLGSDSNAQRYHPFTVRRLSTHRKERKKQKRGEFITPPRPTGRRNNKVEYLEKENSTKEVTLSF